MPLYDCGAPDCEECQRAFKDRTRAIENYHRREQEYAALEKPMPADPSPPCRVCRSKHDVMCYPLETPGETICPECCAKAEHADGETGHVFEYERGERDHVCTKCGIPRAQTDYQPEPMEGDVPLFGLLPEPGETLGTPISEISTTPGKPGYANWLRISQSWGH